MQRRLADLIAQIWHTEEFLEQRPTPIDEARWSFAVIENSLWDAVPEFMRDLDAIADKFDLDIPPHGHSRSYDSQAGLAVIATETPTSRLKSHSAP